jgi:uncharacterized protein (TIGR02145 family)
MINDNQKGISVYLTIIIMAVLLSVSLGMTAIIVGGAKIAGTYSNSVKAFYAADTGVEETLYNAYKQESCGGVSQTYFDSSNNYGYSTEVSGDCSSDTTLDSVGTYGSSTRKIEVNFGAGGGDSSSFSCGDPVTFTYDGSSVTYGTVTSPSGACWLDRNLGASEVATSSTDSASYGDLFQWGRGSDGHQLRSSSTTTEQASSPTEAGSSYIYGSSDWLATQDDDLWQGTSGMNNPCPSGWRLPTQEEWQTEIDAGSWNNASDAYSSSLKLPAAGWRDLYSSGNIRNEDDGYGYYWSSSVDSNGSSYFAGIEPGDVWDDYADSRAYGFSVRCIRATGSEDSFSNTIVNGSFDGTSTGWTMDGGGNKSVSNTDAYSGDYSSYVQYTLDCDKEEIYQNVYIPDVSGSVYLSFYEKTYMDPWAGPIGIQINDEFVWAVDYGSRSGTSSWDQHQIDVSDYKGQTIKLGIAAYDPNSEYCGNGDHNDWIWVDDIELTQTQLVE